MTDYIRGVSRNQVALFPEAVEDYITAHNPVRFIDAFVDKLAVGPTAELTGRRATEQLRRITLDANDASAAPVQRFVSPRVPN